MAISTYSELKTAVTDWMARSDLSGNAADFIRLAEARFNRILPYVESDATLTGTVGSRSISLSSLSISQPVALFVTVDGDEEQVTIKADGTFAYNDMSAQPSFAAFDESNLDFDCLLDQAYSFRLRYRGKLALSTTSPTNGLLTDHPDVYLAGAIVWGGAFIKDAGQSAMFKALLDEFIAETRNQLRQNRRGNLTVDPALITRPRGEWELA